MFDQAEILFTPKSKKELWKCSEAAQKAGDLGMVKRTQALLALAAKAPPQQIAAVRRLSLEQGLHPERTGQPAAELVGRPAGQTHRQTEATIDFLRG
jgi:hypothetical protein